MELEPEATGRYLQLLRFGFNRRIGWVDEQSHDACAVGTNSCSNCSRFGVISTFVWVTPVTLPPGRLRLVTRSSCTGSPMVVKTMGIVVVAAFAASAAGVPFAAMTAT